MFSTTPRISTFTWRKHFDGFANVGQRNDGWRGDDDGAANRDALNQGELNVASARRQIHDEVVEFAPLRAAQKLLDHAVEHGTAPDERLVARMSKPMEIIFRP